MAAGVIKELGTENRGYYTADDVMELLGVSRSKAYKMIQGMQKELKSEGKLFDGYPGGKIPKGIFRKMCMFD
ncbi:MAG: helix-turn-helix domain-containing protein [Lachnospiraceae bacterium]|nr:helix-turn-helix domain-containing protein [Lachnospiraceae bacterium]